MLAGGCAASGGDPFARPRWASRMSGLSWGLDLANFEGVPVRLHGFEMEKSADALVRLHCPDHAPDPGAAPDVAPKPLSPHLHAG